MNINFIESGENLTMVIPILDDVADARSTVISVHQKTIKIIIVDGSLNSNEVFFKGLDNLTYLHYSGSSIYEAMQAGVNLAKSEFICFFGAGDKAVDIKYFNNIDISVGKYRIKGGAIRDGLMCNGYWRNPIHHQAAVYRRSHVNFDTRLKVLADFDLNIALIKNGATIRKIDSIYSDIKPHVASNNFIVAVYEGIKIYWKNSLLIWLPTYLIILLISRIVKLQQCR